MKLIVFGQDGSGRTYYCNEYFKQNNLKPSTEPNVSTTDLFGRKIIYFFDDIDLESTQRKKKTFKFIKETKLDVILIVEKIENVPVDIRKICKRKEIIMSPQQKKQIVSDLGYTQDITSLLSYPIGRILNILQYKSETNSSISLLDRISEIPLTILLQNISKSGTDVSYLNKYVYKIPAEYIYSILSLSKLSFTPSGFFMKKTKVEKELNQKMKKICKEKIDLRTIKIWCKNKKFANYLIHKLELSKDEMELLEIKEIKGLGVFI